MRTTPAEAGGTAGVRRPVHEREPILLWLAGTGLLPPQSSPWAFPVGLVLLTPLSVLVGWLSYLAIERPAATLGVLVDRSGRPRDYYDGS